MCRIGHWTKHTNKTIDPCISDYLNIIELYLSLFCQFRNSAWIKFFVWFTSLLILGFIPDQTFPEVTTRRQKLCVKSKTEFKVNISVKKYKGEKRNKKRVTKENIEVLLRPQWLICWCEEWQERKGKSLVKYDNLALEAFTF